MSKTIDLQVEKARRLAEGIINGRERLNAKGIDVDRISELTDQADAVVAAGNKVDAMRLEVSKQVRQTNDLLEQLKQNYGAYRNLIRNNFPQEQWITFGLQDKR